MMNREDPDNIINSMIPRTGVCVLMFTYMYKKQYFFKNFLCTCAYRRQCEYVHIVMQYIILYFITQPWGGVPCS